MEDSDEQRNPVELLGEEFVARLRRGENPSISEYVEANPEHAETIRALFGTLAALEDLKSHPDDSFLEPAAIVPETPPETIGDFHVLRTIGRGGMGIVYQARQESLGRTVAIKVLIDHFSSSPQAVRRFRREAQAAARLQHPNIVAVFGVGQWENRHYYAMQFIAGRGLDRILAEMTIQHQRDDQQPALAHRSDSTTDVQDPLGAAIAKALQHGQFDPAFSTPSMAVTPLDASPATIPVDLDEEKAEEPSTRSLRPGKDYWRSVAGIGVQAANALHYAHQQGVLHRDIKPGNLMLDNRGHAWLMDFGLAKLLDEADLTNAGDVVGTLRYMAPEQLEGRATTQTDIYGLGLTLYELLTLRPAFARSDQCSVLLKQKTYSAPPTPRSINPQIPDDLQTIVLKAISPDPRHRYASAHELEEDLQRYLDDIPIKARPTSAWEHGRRWCRRNPAIASLAAVTMLLIVASCFAAFFGYVRESYLRAAAETESRRAEANLALASEAFDTVFRRIGVDPPGQSLADSQSATELGDLPTPRLSNNDAQILESLLSFYDRFAETNRNSTHWQYDTALAYRRVGEIQQRLGRAHRAEAAFERAIELLQRIPAQDDSHPTPPPIEIASIYQQLGTLAMAADRFDKAFNQFEQASQTIIRAPIALRELPEANLKLAEAYNAMARARFISQIIPHSNSPGKSDPAEIQKLQSESVAILEKLVDQYPQSGEYRLALAQSWEDFGQMAGFVGDRETSSTYTQKSIHLLEQLVGDFPAEVDYRRTLAWIYTHTAEFADKDVGRTPMELLQAARQLLAPLPPEYADQPETREIEGRISQHIAELKLDQNRLDGIDQDLKQCHRTLVSLAEEFPFTKRYQYGLARSFYLEAIVAYKHEDLREATRCLEQCVAICEVESKSHMPGMLLNLAAKAQRGLVMLQTRQGNQLLAETAADELEVLQQKLLQHDVPPPPFAMRNDPWQLDPATPEPTSAD
ncbi:serine/threonine-protein kinase [Bremerella sp. JC817]|uniref:serine/threonine-protein kinase n=1 Tax=Bremerella sp. JC817 TaxID=3231756 RepID=UPI00345929B2